MRVINLFILLFFVSTAALFADSCRDEAQPDKTKPQYFIDFVHVEEKGEGWLARIYLTNDSQFVTTCPYFYEQQFWEFIDNLQPGQEVFFRAFEGSDVLLMLDLEHRSTWLVNLGRDSKKVFPKIVEIQQLSTGWLSRTYEVTLSDGTIWKPLSYKGFNLIEYAWNVGDTVIHGGGGLDLLINIDAPPNLEWGSTSVDPREVPMSSVMRSD